MAATGVYVCKSRKERLILTGLLLAAPALVVCSLPWAHTILDAPLRLFPGVHITVEASLDLVWLLLAFSAFLHWGSPRSSRRRGHLPGVVSLIFVLSLLVPVISADDDLAQFILINDASTSQSIATTIKSYKQLPSTAGPVPLLATLNSAPVLPPVVASEFVCERICGGSVVDPGGATGNHSPPFLI